MSTINLHLCDCMDFMSTCKENEFDLAICDPPYFKGPEKKKFYGKSVSSHGVRRINYKPLQGSWEIPNRDYYSNLKSISKNQIIWGINYFEFVNLVGPARIIWDKVNDGSTFSNCEIASNSLEKNRISIFRHMWRGMMQGDDSDGTKMNGKKNKQEKRIHPTQKPVKLYKWLLQNYAEPGWIIFDSHGGSMSLAIACIEMGFDCTVCEKHEDCFNDAIKRVQNYCKQLNLLRKESIINIHK